MGRDAVQQLFDRWMNDATFREEVRRDPAGAARRAGLDLDPSELAALQSSDWSLSDEELTARVSKSAAASHLC